MKCMNVYIKWKNVSSGWFFLMNLKKWVLVFQNWGLKPILAHCKLLIGYLFQASRHHLGARYYFKCFGQSIDKLTTFMKQHFLKVANMWAFPIITPLEVTISVVCLLVDSYL